MVEDGSCWRLQLRQKIEGETLFLLRPNYGSQSEFWAALFPFPSFQLCHNIQRTGAHDPGSEHTRRPKVVQQQPRSRDAHELACIWGTAWNLKVKCINSSSTINSLLFPLSCFPFHTSLIRSITRTKLLLLQRRRNLTAPHPLQALTMWLHLVTVAG